MEQNVREVLNHLHRVIGHVDGQCKNPEIGEVAKVSLYQQYFDEKANVINKIYHNLDWFFKNGSAWERNHLTTLEKDMEQRLNQLREHTNPAGGDLALEAHRLIEELGSNINKSISDAKEQAASMSFTDEEAQQLDELRNGRPEGEAFGSVAMEELNRLAAWEGGVRQRMQSLQTQVYQLRDTIARTYYYQINQLSHSLGKPPAASAKKKNMERYIGLNILNALGVLLLIVGTIAAGRLGHIWVAFVLGVGFLVAGEIMNRRRPNVFSMGLTAGGLGISYVTLAIGHFFQESIPMYPALGICVVITALAFYLSTRYKSQTLLAITLVGGYLPILTTLMDTRPDQALIFGMMGYFVMFNLLALVVALRNKWTVATFVGLTLNIAGVRLLTHHIGDDGRIFGIIYTGFAMLVYTIIPIISTRLTKIKFTPWDVALVGVNTFFGSIVLFNILHMWGWWDFAWLVVAVLAVFYGLASLFVSRKFEDAKPMTFMLLVASAAFTIFFVILQIDYMWVSPGLVALATGLAIFGITKPSRSFVIAGAVVGGIALLWHFTADVFMFMFNLPVDWFYITIQSASLTAGSLVVLVMLAIKSQLETHLQKTYKCATLVGLWLFVGFMAIRLFLNLPPAYTPVEHLVSTLFGAFTAVYAIAITKVPRLKSSASEALGITLGIIGIATILLSSVVGNATYASILDQLPYITAIAIAILLLANLSGVLVVHNITKRLVTRKTISPQWLPIVVSTYFITAFTITLTLDFGLTFASFWLSVAYIATALILVILGFVRHSSLLRRAGLCLSLLTVLKLVFFDLAMLPLEFRIWSYFIIGGVLVGISFAYQYFSKRLDAGDKTLPTAEVLEAETPNEDNEED